MTDADLPPANDNARPCAICGKASVARFRPFCSQRCADVDLNRWLSGVYAIPAEEEDEGIAADDAPPRGR